jgi:hypothetical protein
MSLCGSSPEWGGSPSVHPGKEFGIPDSMVLKDTLAYKKE